MEQPSRGSRRFSRDRVVHKGESILIYTPVKMSRWEIRSRRPTAVVYEDRAYRLANVERLEPELFRYTLVPWPVGIQQLPGYAIRYDDSYVAQRDQELALSTLHAGIGFLLTVLLPIVGFLPSGVKAEVEARYMISSRRATAFSLGAESVVLLLHATWMGIQGFLSMYGASRQTEPVILFSAQYLMTVIVVLMPDLILRFSSLFGEMRPLYGFYEWIIPRRRRGLR